jgi:hypothetical protein
MTTSQFLNNLTALFGTTDRPVISPFCEGEKNLFQEIRKAPDDAILFLDVPRPDYPVEAAYAAGVMSGLPFVIGNQTNSAEVRKSMRSLGLNMFQVMGSEGESGHIFATPAKLGGHPAVVPYVEAAATQRVFKAPDRKIVMRKSDLFVFDAAEDVEEKRMVTGVAMSANEIDSDGDFFTPETVFTAMVNFMLWYRNIGLEHIVDVTGDVDIVESWQLREPMEIAGKTVAAGSWMMTLKVWNTRLWDALKDGSLAGFSIGGDAFEISEELEEVPGAEAAVS